MTDALSTHYARALADAVFAPDSSVSPQDALAQLAAAEHLISSSKELQIALLSPAVSKARKGAVISRLADELGLHRIMRNFFMVVVRHRRTRELNAIRQSFQLIVDERSGWIPAEIAAATELRPEQREEIERALGTKLGKFIRAHYEIDPALLGGVRARVASREYDASLRGKLESMRQRLGAQI
ncbi:MAG: ATP synthase F1 subunit delta [Bryobacteraceae bacterium]